MGDLVVGHGEGAAAAAVEGFAAEFVFDRAASLFRGTGG
jgi:hypothetical protein